MKRNKSQSEDQVASFVGVGLDREDDHERVTKSENFLLVGGSEETHERMQSTAIYFNEELEKRGKDLRETSKEEAIDLLREAMDKA